MVIAARGIAHGCVCMTAVLSDDSTLMQDGSHTPADRLTVLVYNDSLLDIRHTYYGQLTPVKTRYLLTSITWPYHRLKIRVCRGHMVFFKLTADQVLGFGWITGSCQVNLL